ncbi:MAG: hypothetical protein V2A54_04545 [Bacteroidota bacterium]
MKIKILIILTVVVGGCGVTFKNRAVQEDNKDVYVLATIIHNHLIKTNGQDFSANDLIEYDTLKTISNNFKVIEFKNRGGCISVCYKFSDFRDNRIVLNDSEKAMANQLKWVIKKMKVSYDGEIQFDFGERFYRIKKIVLKK